MAGFEVRLQRLVHASPATAFRAWVDAESRTRWHRTGDDWVVEAATDLRVGGAWRVASGPSAEEMFVEEGVFLVVEPPHRVVYTCRHVLDDHAPFETQVTVTFEACGSQTLVSLVDAGFPDERLHRLFQGGWPEFLDTFVRTVAAG
jgi:uncharacterized protein YndB with AHSA1/START domain